MSLGTSVGFLGTLVASSVGWIRFWDNWHWTVSFLGGALLATQGWRLAQGQDRRPRSWFVLGAWCYFAGQVLWVVQVYTGWNPYPGPSDILFLAFPACVAIGLSRSLGEVARGREGFAALLDVSGLILMGALGAILWYVPLRGALGTLQLVTTLAYPILFVAALAMASVMILYREPKHSWNWSGFLLLLVVQSATWAEWNALTLRGELRDGTLFNWIFSLCIVPFGWVAGRWSVGAAGEGACRTFVLIRLFLPLGMVLLGAFALTVDVAPSLALVHHVLSVLVIAVAGLRQSLLLNDRDRLLRAREELARSEMARLRDLGEANRRLEEQVEERTRDLRIANAELQAFSYSVSHDLRAPLRAMAGFAQALEADARDRLTDEERDFLARIRNAAKRLSDLIDGLLDLAVAARRPLTKADLALSRLFAEVHEELRPVQDRVLELDIQTGLVLRGDPSLVRQVVQNLLLNAWKFARGTEPARARVRGGSDADGDWFEIEDDGVGFDPSYAGKLFGAFQRLHGTEYPGHGIGLALVAKIVERHGGRVSARGAVDRGAAFRCVFPVR